MFLTLRWARSSAFLILLVFFSYVASALEELLGAIGDRIDGAPRATGAAAAVARSAEPLWVRARVPVIDDIEQT